MLSKTATAALGRINQTAFTRTFVLSSINYDDSSLVSAPQKAIKLAEANDPRVKKITPLDVPLAPLITELPQETKERLYPQIGNRDIVGPSHCMIIYSEEMDRPLPAVRWGANSPEIDALREKEKGSWNDLSMAEKKQLYRHSFRQTIAELEAPTGEWKKQLFYLLYALGLTGFLLAWNKVNGYIDPEPTFSDEHTDRMIKRMIREYRNPMMGIAAQYDYETGQWKK